MKTCTKCNQEKHLDCFYKNRKNKELCSSWCKDCSKKESAKSVERLNSTIRGRAISALRNAKRRITKNGHELFLNVDDVVELWEKQSGVCAYSGREMTFSSKSLNTMSLERIDSSIGYTKENTILVCNAINRMKSNFELEDFRAMCLDVAMHFNKNKNP